MTVVEIEESCEASLGAAKAAGGRVVIPEERRAGDQTQRQARSANGCASACNQESTEGNAPERTRVNVAPDASASGENELLGGYFATAAGQTNENNAANDASQAA